MLPGLILAAALASQVEPVDVAIIYHDQTVIMPLANARRLYTSTLAENDLALKAALAIALGTLPSKPLPVNLRADDIERERWQRQPAQKPIPDF